MPAGSRSSWLRIEELFHAALEHEPAARTAFLREACGGDGELLAEIEQLLRADTQTGGFLKPDALALGSPEGWLAAESLPSELGPYRILGELGRGGMGVVLLAERADAAFEKRVAIKMLAGPASAGLLERFALERRTLARLEHPGIARVLDAGRAPDGRPYLVMEAVEGEPIDRWCAERDLSVRERVALFACVCDAVAYAHDKLVVHRDLKPANVLVDREGRPRLLDFGIAKVLAEEEQSSSRTVAGERLLTPSYASPEQIRGEATGVASDVYSLGVLLYELLTGMRPYRTRTGSRAELERAVLEQAPEPPSAACARSEPKAAAGRALSQPSARRRLSGDLDRIVLMALRKEPERRYRSAAELGADLRRWLENRPVEARGQGLAYRAQRFARRHPVEVVLLAALLVVGVSSAGVFARQSLRERAQLVEIQQLADAERLESLVRAAADLWPAVPERIPALERWLDQARALLSRRELHAATQRDLELASDQATREEERVWLAWRRARLEELLAGLEALGPAGADEPAGASAATIPALERRLELARETARVSLEQAASEWAAASAAIADPARSPRYAGLALERQLGLVPLGPDPASGLWEFWHVASGRRPQRGGSGALEPRPESGLVFVLVPGGTFTMGAQAEDPSAANHDPRAESDEAPVREVALPPFFLSKHEMTQAQWQAWTGQNPSDYPPGVVVGERTIAALHPVEQVSWERARAVLFEMDLELPSEEQWEYACRAGTGTPWWTGADEPSLAGSANLADRWAREHGGSPGWTYADWGDDGHTVHAPVGSYRPNPFGLFDMAGNVWEWTADSYGASGEVVARGGGFGNPAVYLRSAERYPTSPTLESRSTGLRPARAVRGAQ